MEIGLRVLGLVIFVFGRGADDLLGSIKLSSLGWEFEIIIGNGLVLVLVVVGPVVRVDVFIWVGRGVPSSKTLS